MDVIALTVFGFLLLGFITYWTLRHQGKAEAFLQGNQNVMPLLREKSAKMKYEILHEALADEPTVLQQLDQLKQDYTEGIISAETYEEALSRLQQEYIKR